MLNCRNGVIAIMELDKLTEVRMGYSFRSRLEHDPEGDVMVIQMKDIDDANRLHPDDAIRVNLPKRGRGHHLLRAGDLLFRSRGRSNDAALVLDGIGTAVLSAPMLLIRPHGVLPDYLCWFINAPPTQAQLAALAEGTSVRMISAEALKSLDIPLPPEAQQRRIAEVAALAQREQALLAAIAARRQRLITHLLMQHARQTPS